MHTETMSVIPKYGAALPGFDTIQVCTFTKGSTAIGRPIENTPPELKLGLMTLTVLPIRLLLFGARVTRNVVSRTVDPLADYSKYVRMIICGSSLLCLEH